MKKKETQNTRRKITLTTKQEIPDSYFKWAAIGLKKKNPSLSGISILWIKSNTLKYVLRGGRPGSKISKY